MSCAACSSRVEKAVSALEGVEKCSVNLLTNSMSVEGSATDEEITGAVVSAGYGIAPNGKDDAKAEPSREKAGKESKIKKRLITSVVFLVLLMYISMGHGMLSLPLPGFMERNPVAIGLAQLLIAGIVMVINQSFFISGVRGILHKAPNMDTLVAMGSFASFAYSVYALFCMSGAQAAGDHALAMEYLHDLYFESAAMILTLITVGKMLEARAKGKTTSALEGLMRLAPKTATLLRDGKEVTVAVEQVQRGDIFIVRPGEQIPVDGTVIEGSSAVNESALTGESLPVDKEKGSGVCSGTLNESGVLRCRASRVGEDTTLAGIIRMVSDAAATKAPIAKIADRVSGIFVPTVITIAAVTFAAWLVAGQEIGFAVARAVSVLVISCPCALGLATPVAIMVGTGVGARHGILFKTATALEETGKTKIVVLDKTGTITKGDPAVVGIYPAFGRDEIELLTLAADLEKNSEHPLAKAIIKAAGEKGTANREVTEFRASPGAGVSARLGEDMLYGGNLKTVGEYASIPDDVRESALALANEGKTPLFFAKNSEYLGMIAVSDVIKEDSIQAVAEMKKMGIRVVMLTGDNLRTAEAIGKVAGVDEVIAGVLPKGKEEAVRRLAREGRVAMVGDGINDAPALTAADIGIAIGNGTDIAIDASDVVLMKSRLSDVPLAIRLSKATLRNIKQNLFWAFFYNIIGIPLAAGIWYPLWGWKLNPMFGAAAMSLSSFCVVTNALRLNFFRGGRNGDKEQKTDDSCVRVITVKGMMCGHCEAAVREALLALPGVQSASADHQRGEASVTLSGYVSDADLKKAVSDKGYKVKKITGAAQK